MADKSNERGLKRRDFIKRAVATAGVATLVGFGVTESNAKENICGVPSKWDKTTDVVIVGSGGAGLFAAIEAYDAGAKVIVLESMPTTGGATRICGAATAASNSMLQKEKGFKDSEDTFYKDVIKNGEYANIKELARVVVDKSGETVDLLIKFGAKCKDIRPYLGHTATRVHQFESANEYIKALESEVKKRGIPILTQTKLTRLFVKFNEQLDFNTKVVVGVEALTSKGKKISIKSKKGVVLATGGFAGDSGMIDRYSPMYIGALTQGAPGCTGDGLIQAMRFGADCTHLNFIGSYPLGLQVVPGSRNGVFCRSYNFTALGGIYVNKEGLRFVLEDMAPTHITDYLVKQTDKAMYVICDSIMWEKGNSSMAPTVIGWSKEQFIEAVKKGTIGAEANSIEELAGKVGIDPAGLKKTVSEYNSFVAKKQDTMFGRSAKALKAMIEKPPFYVVKTFPIVPLVVGGLRINPRSQVVDVNGNIFPHLYAAGEVTGGTAGSYYMGGLNTIAAFVSGRVAGKNVAGEKA
jgi:fumarate reductase flavoprotein subunit